MEEGDESAFNDAIYRSNQAFEGSIKEAYRVLAERDPQGATPHQIEQYLQQKNLFRERVLSQFSNYRTNWRNPSVHDYNLAFDENEAFLAIASVSAFSKMLVDQIVEKLSYISVRDDVYTQGISEPIPDNRSLIQTLEELILSFLSDYALKHFPVGPGNLSTLTGAIAGYLTKAGQDYELVSNFAVKNEIGRILELDILASRGVETVAIDVKTANIRPNIGLGPYAPYLAHILNRSQIKSGILVLYENALSTYTVENHNLPGDIRMKIIAPPLVKN